MTVKVVCEHLLMASAFVLFFAQGFDFIAQEKPVPPATDYVKPTNAKEEFTFPQIENGKANNVKTEADVRAIVSKVKVTKPKAEGKQPAPRTRGVGSRDWCKASIAGYKGLCSIYQFTNNEFPSSSNTCGQAAAATIITHWHGQKNNLTFRLDLTKYLYSAYGPDNALGLLGTSWQTVVNSITKPYNMGWRKVSGEADLRQELDRQIPVIVMLDAARMRDRGYRYPASPIGIMGHWVIVYGYNDDYYFLTNHPNNWIARDAFLESWNTWMHGGFDGGERGYVFWK